MITEVHARQILEQAIRRSPAHRTVAYLMGGKEALTRFAENTIHQNVLKKDYYLKVVVEHEGKVGMAMSNLFRPENIDRTVDAALAVAKAQSKPSRLFFTDRVEAYPKVDLYDEATIEMPPVERALKVKEIIDLARAKNYRACGAFSVGDWITAIASNSGFYGYHTETSSNLTVTVMDQEGLAGWGEHAAHKVSEIDHLAVARHAVGKVDHSRRKHVLGPGQYDVVLEHSAVTSLLMFMIYLGMSAQDVQEGTSFMQGKLGQKITGDNFTLIDDFSHPGTPGRAFDYQGVTRKPITLIEKGVARAYVHDLETAQKEKTVSTGHGNPYPSLYGPMPFNTRIEPGTSSIPEMIKSTKRGIYVTHFHYDNVVDPKVPILTGMTRDGTFLIENGEIVGSIGNLRYNERLLETFSRIEALSADRKFFFEAGKMLVPAMKIRDFNFTGGTAGAQ